MSTLQKIKENYWLRSAFYTVGQRGSMMIFGLGGFMILIRLLSKEDFGVYALFISIITILEVLRNGFLRNGLIRSLSQVSDSDHKDRIKGASLGLNYIFSAFQIIFFALASQWLERVWNAPGLAKMLYIQIIASLIMPLFWHYEYVGQANLSFRGLFWSHFVRRGGFAIYLAYMWFFDGQIDLLQVSWMLTLFTFLGALAGGWFTLAFHPLRVKWDKIEALELANYGKYTFGTNVSAQSLKNVDQWFLGSMIGTGAVASYNPAIRISGLVEVPTLSMASMLFPALAKRIRKEGMEVAGTLYMKSVGAILAITLPAALVVLIFPEWIILFLAGSEYLDTVDLLRVTILYTLFIPFARQFGVVLDAIGLQKVNFYFVLISALLNVGFNWLFITLYGVIGAAYGTLATYFIGFVYNQIYLNRKLNTHPKQILSHTVKAYGLIFNRLRKKA